MAWTVTYKQDADNLGRVTATYNAGMADEFIYTHEINFADGWRADDIVAHAVKFRDRNRAIADKAEINRAAVEAEIQAAFDALGGK